MKYPENGHVKNIFALLRFRFANASSQLPIGGSEGRPELTWNFKRFSRNVPKPAVPCHGKHSVQSARQLMEFQDGS